MGKRARRRAREARDERVALGAHGTGDPGGPLAEVWGLDGPLAELVALYGADTTAALHRVLLIPGRRRDTLVEDAVSALRRVHAHDRCGLREGVLLACTHHRWRNVARQLLEELGEAGLLDEADTGELARLLLHADVACVTVPGAWLSDFYRQQRGDVLCPLDPRATYTLRRPIAPQLRRWAACRSVHARGDVERVLRRALQLDSRHGAAAVLGLLDAADRLDDDTRCGILDIGLDWPAPSVRLTALKRLAASGRAGQALERAARDRAATIRRWAAAHRQDALRTDRATPTRAVPDEVPPEPASQSADPAPAGPLQPSLFG